MMTVREPEIVLGGDAPLPSAPAPSFDDGPPVSNADLPIAVATPLSAVAPAEATAIVVTTPLSAVAPAEATGTGATLERSTNADGSLAVKRTTATPLPDGRREVKIEHFHVPANAAYSLEMDAALDAGEPPSAIYMTKVERQVLPPGTEPAIGRPPQGPATAYSTCASPDPDHPQTDASPLAVCCSVACCIFVVLFILGGIEWVERPF